MRLRRIEVTKFRKLSHTVVEGLGDGLNVVVGNNEAGKSTLLAALRAVFFERHRVGGRVAEEMQPFGQAVRPEIIVDFELDGADWRLRKAFCKRQEAELTGPDGTVAGDEVEERLADLLGFVHPGAGGSKPEQHQGAHGLLWVRQGAAHQALGVGAGRDAIAAALESEVGQVLGGERGRALVAAAEARWQGFWDKRGNPRGEWRKLQDEAAGLEVRRSALAAQLATYEGKVEQLAACRRTLARHAEENSLAHAEVELAAVRRELEEAGRIEAQLRDAELRRKLAAANYATARDRQTAREGLVRKVAETARALDAARGRAADDRAGLARIEAVAEGARGRIAAAREGLEAAATTLLVLERAAERRRAREELDRLGRQLAMAEAADAARREAEERAEACPVTKKTLATLDRLQATLDAARSEARATAVEIEFRPEGTRAVEVGGLAHDPAALLHLGRAAEMRLEGFGGLVVRPGGDADARARAEEEARRALVDALRPLGLADIAAARAVWTRAEEDRSEARAQGQAAGALAPEGLDALRALVAARRRVVEVAGGEDPQGDPNVARALRDTAAAALSEAEAQGRQADALRGQAVAAAARAEAEAGAAEHAHASLAAELEQVRQAQPDDRLAEDLAAAEAALGVARRAEEEAQAALAAADLDVLRLRLKRAEGAEAAIRQDIAEQRRAAELLETELSALGRDGLGEQLAEVEGQTELARRRLAAMDHEAQAARLLHEALDEAQSDSKERWLGPVKARVTPYLRLLAPDGEVVLDEETLEIRGVRRQGRHEPFDALSVGAREQMAVITRLALADVLRGAGRPSAVILDDALVNTDEARLERMHLILHRAAENLQVLILTCRERDFRQLGAPVTRIQ